MTYSLGIDLGTTYSAAAVHRDGRARIVELGTRSASIPSVVFLREDGTVLAGEAAQRRAAAEPHRVAREFKRRIGDTTPMLLGGAAYSAEALTARLLRWIVAQVTEREGGAPTSIAITHPANWGPYKTDLIGQAVRLAEVGAVELITEPEAAARHYASHERVEDGSVVAVYDLGGGTFDAAILCKAPAGFELLGRPEGIERLGGIDFDAAVLGHVIRALGGAVEELDPDDPVTLQALARLRHDCVDAKEGLSSDTDVSIPVLLPTVQTEIRLTRSEFESMIRPALADSLAALRRAMASAEVDADDVSAVLLVGGSSRIPLVAQLVSYEFGRPVAVDADPKHAIALGAAAAAAEGRPVAAEPAKMRPADGDLDPAGTGAAATIAAPPRASEHTAPDDTPSPAATPDDVPATDASRVRPVSPPRHDDAPKSKVPVMIGAALAAVTALVAGIVIVSASGGDSPERADALKDTETTVNANPVTPPTEPTTTTIETVAEPGTALPVTDAPEAPPATSPPPTTTVPAATPCPTGLERTACITSISVDGDGGLTAAFETSGYVPELEPIDHHIHFYFDTAIDGDENNAGSAGSGDGWRLWDAPNPFVATGGDGGRPGYTVAEAREVGATQLCSIVADTSHAAIVGTGNCIDLPDTVTDPAAATSAGWLDGYSAVERGNYLDACPVESGPEPDDVCSCIFDHLATELPFGQFVRLDAEPDPGDAPLRRARAACTA